MEKLNILLGAAALFCAWKWFCCNIGCHALALFYLERGEIKPTTEEISDYQRKVVENFLRDLRFQNSI